MAQVLDASAFLAFLSDDFGAADVEALLIKSEKAKRRVLITPLTWSELYFRALKVSREAAAKFTSEMMLLPVEVFFEDERLILSQEAASLRARGVLSDDEEGAYAVALARVKRAELWTAKRHFSALDDTRVHLLARN